jgi:signal transduction histidine kinase
MRNQADILLYEIVLIMVPSVVISLGILAVAIFKIMRLRTKLNRYKKMQFYEVEKERKRIANDLHDFVAGKLTVFKQDLSTIFQEVKDVKLRASLEDTLSEVSYFHDDLRFVVEYIYPRDLMLDDLKGSLIKLAEEMSTSKSKVILQYDLSKGLTNAQMHQLYRIIQEKLANIITYIVPKNIVISVAESDDGKSCELGISYANQGEGLGKKHFKSLLARGGRGQFVISERLNILDATSNWSQQDGYFQETIEFSFVLE